MKGQSGPQDVARGMFVCRGAMRASLAGEFRLRDAVRARCVPTGFAAVGAHCSPAQIPPTVNGTYFLGTD